MDSGTLLRDLHFSSLISQEGQLNNMSNEHDDVHNTQTPDEAPEDGFVDTAEMGVQCHLVIKDLGTDITIVNQRG